MYMTMSWQKLLNNYLTVTVKMYLCTTKKLSAYYNDLLSVPEVPRANRKATGRCVQPANIKKIHDIIRCALNQAIRWEYIDTNKRNPASLATLPKVPKVKRKVWSVDTFREAMLMYGKVSQENYVELTAASAIPNKEIKSPQILRY